MIKIKIYILIISYLFILSGLSLRAQSFFYKTIDSLVNDAFVDLNEYCLSNQINSFTLNITSSNEILRNLIINKLGNLYQISFSDSNFYKLVIFNSSFYTTVRRIISFPLFGEKVFEVEHILELEYNLLDFSNNNLLKSQSKRLTKVDTMSLTSIQREKLDYSNSVKLPVYREVLEPAIITSVTGLMVYLLFIIRSK